MPNPSEVTLRLLTVASESLNQASDLLNKNILEVEDALQKFNLGITAQVDLYAMMVDDQNGLEHIFELGYGKINGKWGLLVIDYINQDPDDTWRAQFLREAPRETRLRAVDELPKLIEKLAEEGAKAAAETTKKAEAARQIASSISKKGK